MEPADNKQTTENCQKSLNKQPTSSPWSTIQPYPSISNKPESGSSGSGKSADKSCPSIQQSSSQFFYFLRLMQLFPETHPATLHTVLCLCHNNFFYAVDKLLYARKCKALYNQNQRSYRRCPYDRSQPPHCSHGDTCKPKRDKVLDLKVPNAPKDSPRTCSTSEDSCQPSTSSDSQSVSQDSSLFSSCSLLNESLESRSASTSEAKSSEENTENQSIIQDSDIIII